MMNFKNSFKLLLIGISFILFGFSINYRDQVSEKELIKGVWISQEDPNWRIEFKDNEKCYWYYTGESHDIYYYSISTTSPQCGNNVSIGKKFSYLKLVNTVDSSDLYCYEINTLSNEYLTLMFVGGMNMKLKVFKKQIFINPHPDDLPDLDEGQY